MPKNCVFVYEFNKKKSMTNFTTVVDTVRFSFVQNSCECVILGWDCQSQFEEKPQVMSNKA